MGLIAQIKSWRDRRHQIIQLEHEINGYWDEFNHYVKKNELVDGTEPYEQVWSEYSSYREIPESQRDQLLTMSSVQKAYLWGIPLPAQPSRGDYSNEHWQWNRVTNRYSLTMAGHRYIRHEVSIERDIKYRPMLSWAAIGISFFSLAVSVLKP